MTPQLLGTTRQDLSTAFGIATAKQVPHTLQSKLLVQINEAFVTGLHHGVLFAAAATLLGVIIVLRYLPAHGTEVDGIPAATSAEELVDPTALDDYDDGHGEPAERALVPDA